eukprot:CAMPEP_0201508206 /NCGR_PEP_ID=MMETSP0161_2-20130828/1639_1 /ASSEMBLY_ACC=CAM_ASM_000251 /TAXON_ID=180227 /ORGANISM="Neoparamoeba aestuarina, Strain SoJaBio B1-5/56/2" /LENGTH=245 /DNA_ID=CAMNT_0047902787 /DNA_START=52 /DNA_END=787 /DNA_ORIENTATION=-
MLRFSVNHAISHARCYSTKPQSVAIILAGSGVYDGSEITEAVSCLVNVSRHSGFEPACFAPDEQQHHAVDHTSGNEEEAPRNVLKESARIARGKVTPLADLNADDHAAIIIPGGFGVAKNLSNFALTESSYEVHPQLSSVLSSFHSANKPIGLCCISPILAGRLFHGSEITIGSCDTSNEKWPYAGVSGRLGDVKLVECDISQIHVDKKNKIVTSPAYMYDAAPHEAYDSVEKMVNAVISLCEKN